MSKSEHMQTVGTCGAKEQLTRAGTRDIGRGRQHRLFYVSLSMLLGPRIAASCEWVERQRGVEVEGIDRYYEWLFAEIDATKRGKTVEEHA
jgi:hypothetical protein